MSTESPDAPPPPEPTLASSAWLVPFVLCALVASFWARRGRTTASSPLASQTSEAASLSQSQPASDETTPQEDSEAENFDQQSLRYCPVCLSAYLPETQTCDECGVDLDDEPLEEAEPNPPAGRERTVRIARISDPIRCSLVLSFLHTQGIPCTLARNIVMGATGGDIYVFEGDAFHAKRLIYEFLLELEQEPLPK